MCYDGKKMGFLLQNGANINKRDKPGWAVFREIAGILR